MPDERTIVDDLTELLAVLPAPLQEALQTNGTKDSLLEIVLDLGRLPEARYTMGYVQLSDEPITAEHLKNIVAQLGSFGPDNRAGIERTLHRISAIRNRDGIIVGITCRVGRAVFGTVGVIRDVLETGKSILLLGRPGVGKTTLLREVARVTAGDLDRRVIIVDTSNEIAGDGDVPHPAIGRARRMQVPNDITQAQVMIEAVENHMPEVIVIDEIGVAAEAEAARTIAERGVQLIATAHGNTLENLVLNPVLADLVGGVHVVTLGDEEARHRGTQKSVLERKAPPTFDVVVEVQERERVAIHYDVATTVDLMLRGTPPTPEVRERDTAGDVTVVQKSDVHQLAERMPDNRSPITGIRSGSNGVVRVYAYAVSRERLDRAIEQTRAPLVHTRTWHEADLVLTIRGHYRKMPKRLREAEARGLPVHVIRSNTQAQINAFVDGFVGPGRRRKGQ